MGNNNTDNKTKCRMCMGNKNTDSRTKGGMWAIKTQTAKQGMEMGINTRTAEQETKGGQ
jgi:hypothetical protein